MEGRHACLIFFGRLSDQTIPLPHFWEHTIGSGRATLALRAEWQRQLQRCQAELGVRHVRSWAVCGALDSAAAGSERDKG